MSNKYYLLQNDDKSNDSKVFMRAKAMHIGTQNVTFADPCEAAGDMDAHEVFHTLATMQHKLLCMVVTDRFDSDNIKELESMFETSAETLALFNMLLIRLGKGSEALNDAINAAQKAFDESLEAHLNNKTKEEA